MVNKSVIRLRREQLAALPPALMQTLPNLTNSPQGQGSVALVCRGSSCLPPVSTGEGVINALTE
jgi:uncharacterized protein YyaL (SSP411 family)